MEDCTTRVRSLMYSVKPDSRRRMDLALHGLVNEYTLRAYEMAKVYLEEKLGPAKWVCDERGAHLEFYPRRFGRGHLTSLSNGLGISSTWSISLAVRTDGGGEKQTGDRMVGVMV